MVPDEIILNATTVSPAQNHPVDILAEIFSYHTYDKIIPPTQPTILRVLQVCQSWRNAGCGTALLWRTLSVDFKRVRRWGRMMDILLAVWARNSRNIPLSLSVDCPNPDSASPSSGCLSHILLIIHRLSKIDIRCSEIDISSELWNHSYVPLPLLEEVTIRVDYSYPSPLVALHLFTIAPQLSKAVIGVGNLKIWLPSQFTFPWGQFNCLEITQELKFEEWLDVFRQCNRLETGTFSLYPLLNFRHQRSQSFDHLRSLSITFHSFSTGVGNLHELSFPALRSLSLAANKCRVPVSIFLLFFASNTLQYLCLAQVRVELSLLIQCLEGCSSLKELRLDLPHLGNNIYRSLLDAMTASTVLSTVTKFATCIVVEDEDIHFESSAIDLVDFVKRGHHSRSLTTVQIFVQSHTHDPYSNRNDKDLALEYIGILRSGLRGETDGSHEGRLELETIALNSTNIGVKSPILASESYQCRVI